MALIVLFLICFHAHGAERWWDEFPNEMLAITIQVRERDKVWEKDQHDMRPYLKNIISVFPDKPKKGLAVRYVEDIELKSFVSPLMICLMNASHQSPVPIKFVERFLKAFSALSRIYEFVETKPIADYNNARHFSIAHASAMRRLVLSVAYFCDGLKDSHYEEYNAFHDHFMQNCLLVIPQKDRVNLTNIDLLPPYAEPNLYRNYFMKNCLLRPKEDER
ncbi:MAG: hypothetical protein OXC30_03330 [Alphaproteobacteria bacterium]|nr:hypothetical protein [Alphaproteobacteria bacterium]